MAATDNESIESKKLALIRILQILTEHSDEEHPLTQTDIIEHLRREYGTELDRRAVGRNISLLEDAGMDIFHTKDGVYLKCLLFEDEELKLLIDGVNSSPFITDRQSEELIGKLCSLSSEFFAKKNKHIYGSGTLKKSKNPNVFYNIGGINMALDKKRQISFDYFCYDGADKEPKLRGSYTLTPLRIMIHDRNYVLVGMEEKKNLAPFISRYKGKDKIHDVKIFYIDAMRNIKIMEDLPAVSPDKNDAYAGGIDYKDIMQGHLTLRDGRLEASEEVVFTCPACFADDIRRVFGEDIRIVPYNENEYRGSGFLWNRAIKVTVTMDFLTILSFALQYSGDIIIISPREYANSVYKEAWNVVLSYSGHADDEMRETMELYMGMMEEKKKT